MIDYDHEKVYTENKMRKNLEIFDLAHTLLANGFILRAQLLEIFLVDFVYSRKFIATTLAFSTALAGRQKNLRTHKQCFSQMLTTATVMLQQQSVTNCLKHWIQRSLSL